MYVNVIYLRKLTPKSKELEGWGVGERGRGWRGVLDGKRGGGGGGGGGMRGGHLRLEREEKANHGSSYTCHLVVLHSTENNNVLLKELPHVNDLMSKKKKPVLTHS